MAHDIRALRPYSNQRIAGRRIIGKPQSPRAQLLSENSILFAQIVDGMLLLLVHPPGERNDYESEGI
jgi:hypothetical protein